MRRQILITTFSLLLGITGFGQHFCGTISPEEAIRNNKNLSKAEKEEKITELKTAEAAKWAKWARNSRSSEKEDVLIIPVVFHIFHKYGPENISEAQVRDQVRAMNEDFTGTNDAREDVIDEFQDIIGNANVEFRLATVDPDGNCTNGIIRYYEPDTYFNDRTPIQQLKQQVGWPSNQYMNAYVVGSISASGGGRVLGYAQFPGFGSPATDGIVMVHDAIGAIGTSNPRNAAVTSHEIGHWFSLFHTWGNCAAAGEEAACNCDDGVDDTPLTEGHPSTCILGSETCGSLDNVQNFMDYSFCFANFTQGQADRMRLSLENDDSRSNLYTAENLALTGADYAINEPPTTLCEASMDFNNNKVYCVGEEVTFNDRSFHNITSRTWTFEDADIDTSEENEVVVSFLSEGTKTITLEVSNGVNTLTTTREIVIRGVDERGNYPFSDDIENVDLTNIDQYEVPASGDGRDWIVSDDASTRGGTRSLFVNNRFASSEAPDKQIISNTIDLSNYEGTEGLSLQYDYAYARRDNSSSDVLQLAYSNDCGESWTVFSSKSARSLLTAPNTTANFVPADDSQWDTEVVTIPENLYTDNFQFRFTLQSGGGNNIYLDNIRINETGKTDIQGLERQLTNFDLFPVPTASDFTVSFTLLKPSELQMDLLDLNGKLIANLGSRSYTKGTFHEVKDVNVPAGVYVFRISGKSGILTKRMIVR